MLKMLYFWRKDGKFTAALEVPPQNPFGLRRLEALPQDPATCYSCSVLFWALLRFFSIGKITTYYLILEWQL